MDYEKKDIIREAKGLYGDINTCISDLVNAKIARDLYMEGRANVRMQGLMTAVMQYLGCVIDFLEEQKVCLSNNSKTSESEDERTRKELVEKISKLACGCFISQEQKQNFISYLEKQKEPKHDATDAKSERVIEAARRVLNNWLDGTDCPDVSGAFVELEYAIRKYDGDEKQKEQKPVEIHIDNPNIEKFDPDVKITTSDSSADGDELLYVCNKSYKIGYRDGKRDAERKPAEYIPDSVKFSEGYKTGREVGFREGVESVKPAEWSEEDEKMLVGIIQRGSAQIPPSEPALRGEQMKWLMNRLKSLRPQYHGDVTMTEAYKMGL